MKLHPNSAIDSLAPYALANLSVPQGKTLISLAQNELCFGPTEEVREAGSLALDNAQLYPDPDWTELTSTIAEVHDLNRQQILCGAGSMELLEVIGRIYLAENDRVLMSEYGYSFFKTVAQMYGASVDIAKEKNYTVSVDLLLASVNEHTKIVFIANPANPTGTFLSSHEVRRLRNELPNHVLLVVDEAYAEFVVDESYTPLFDMVDLLDCGNTIILRTFSKIYGLAGMRVGWGYFPEESYAAMRKALNPNNVSLVSQAAATIAISQQNIAKQRGSAIASLRRNFSTDLMTLAFAIPPSHTNFVLIEFSSSHNAKLCFNKLREHGILMRPMDAYGLTHCLRATISHEEHMDFAVQQLTQIVEEGIV